MKFSTIAVLLLAAANSAHANYDEVAIKEQKIAEEVRNSAANLEKAEEALEKRQNGIRGGGSKPVRTEAGAKTNEVEDNDEVEYMNGTPMRPKCKKDECPRKYAAFDKAERDYDIEKMKDYDPDPVKYLNGVPLKETCDQTKGDEHERNKCAHRHQAYKRAEEKFEEENFKGRAGSSGGKPEGGRGPAGGKPEGGRGPAGGKPKGRGKN